MTTSRNAPCPCGSELRYKNCCGKPSDPVWDTRANGRVNGSLLDPALRHYIENEPRCEFEGRDLPPGIFVKQLDDSYNWRQIAADVAASPDARSLGVVNTNNEISSHSMRVTTLVDTTAISAEIETLVEQAYRQEIEPFYQRKLRWFEQPKALRYKTDGFYRPHADADGLNEQGDGWQRILDRHLSLLIYLDDDYEGGHLTFPNFNFRIRPRSGQLMAFPSDWRYLHGAMPVTQGIRHAIVSWSAVQGEQLVRDKPPEFAHLMEN